MFCYKYLLVGCGKLKFTTSYGLSTLEPSENIDFTNKKDPQEGLFVNGGNDEARLGFAPRSQSFALKPNGLAGSICSLSGLTHYRSCRPSANPPNSQFALLPTIILALKKATQGGFS